ncbi:MAG: thioredoxin family protein [Deltaproteobacteria bacterium]|nr:thioredoxin family protein [Deltaproteobacteria bacterium]MCL5793184.1 thioredoxin family protein [Deltaproteobacteria bacterium]
MVKAQKIDTEVKKSKSDSILSINCEEFYRLVLKSNVPVIINFWADWCKQCNPVKEELEKLTKKYKNKVTFYKVNYDLCPSIISNYQITALPAVLIYYQGEPIEKISGAIKTTEYERVIGDVLTRLNN